MPSSSPSRRHFFFGPLFTAAIPAAGFGTSASLTRLGYKSPNELLNIAAIGAGGKGNSDLAGCATENIVALCDVDDRRASRPYAKYPRAARYRDFRQMLDREARNIDAVIIATPDHTHAVATLACMELGKHVYTQKPLTRTIHEARELTRAAARYKVATQMGNQGYSNEGTRQCAELIWSGAIGPVREVHAWTNRPIWPQGFAETPKPDPVPTGVDWNLWLGPAAKRPYSSAYMPWTWRGFYDFGCGALGDMACHILGAPNMALLLGAPTSVECTRIEGRNDLTYPTRSILRFDFPARPSMPPVTIYWYDGIMDPPHRPSPIAANEILGDIPRPPRTGPPPPPPPPGDINAELDQRIDRLVNAGSNGSLFIGEKGMLTTGTYGEYTRLVPSDRMKDFQAPAPLLTRSPGHYRDWIRACKGGDPACSNFSIAGPFTEWILLGSLALRFPGKLEWDSANLRITNNREANALLRPADRKSW